MREVRLRVQEIRMQGREKLVCGCEAKGEERKRESEQRSRVRRESWGEERE